MAEHLVRSQSAYLAQFSEIDDWATFAQLVLETAENSPGDVETCRLIAELAETQFVGGSESVFEIYRFAAPTPELVKLVASASAETLTPVGVDKPRQIEPVAVPSAVLPLKISAREPLKIARVFVEARYHVDGVLTLHHQHGAFYRWDGKRYRVMGTDTLRSELYRFLDNAVTPEGSAHKAFNPDKEKVNKVIDAIGALVHLDAGIAAPAWLEGEAPVPELKKLIACQNGLLYAPTRQLLPHNPRFWSLNVLEFDHDPKARAPRWERLLGEFWPEARDAQATLQQVFGLCLTDDTRFQKAFLIVGPRRSGKSTISRVLRGLVGEENHIGPSADGFVGNFGLQSWIDKRVAVLPDARFGTGQVGLKATERLLSIIGEDTQEIDRKYLGSWSGTLRTRIIVLTNELPKFRDDSGALAGRFIVLPTKYSFFGNEDPNLTNTLLGERPGILNWALDGLDQLYAEGRFVQPACGRQAARMLEVTSSSIKMFVEERCELGADHTVQKTKLFDTYKHWADTAGIPKRGLTPSLFSQQLWAAYPNLDDARPGASTDPDRQRVYVGIRLRSQFAAAKPNLRPPQPPAVLSFRRRM